MVQIIELLPQECVAVQQTVATMPEAIHLLVNRLAAGGCLADAAAFETDVLAREQQGATCMGRGLAIPHAKSEAVRRLGLAAITLAPPLDVPTPDHESLRLMFMIAAPADAQDQHVLALARLATLLMDARFCAELSTVHTAQAFLNRVAAREADLDSTAEAAAPREKRLLGVTGCPAGLAHTYLAAEALQQSAERHGVAIKVETNGAAKVGDPLTEEDIRAADCIIVAADRSIAMERFEGKRLIQVPVGAAVRNADALIEQALEGRAEVYTGKWKPRRRDHPVRGVAESLYRHTMNGISRMLPFVTGGGLMLALSLLAQQMSAPAWVATLLGRAGDAAFVLMYPILAGFLAVSIGGNAALMPGMLGGYLAELGVTVQAEETWISSGFLGALVAGFAAGLIVRLLVDWGEKLPKTLDHVKASLLYPGIGLLVVGALVIGFINPPLGHFNQWTYGMLHTLTGGSRVVLCAVLGLLMATDYGGPMNKAAYVFGTFALLNEQYDVMAAVMLGGMVPPIGVALASILFPTRFTKGERQLAPENIVLGASFVTEGALPFALRDPLRVIPACCLGSAIAGMMAPILGCGCPAPHGGLFLLPVLHNPGGFLAALTVGALVNALALGLLKRPLPPVQDGKPMQQQHTA